MARRILSRDGVLGLWQGLRSQLQIAMLSSAIMFASKEKVQEAADVLLRASGAKKQGGKNENKNKL